MKDIRFFYRTVLLIVCAAFYGACTTVTPSFSSNVDYTDGRSVIREIEHGRSLIAEKPLEALLRAKRLALYAENTAEVQALYQQAETAVEKAFAKATESGNWEEGLRLYRSLTALGKPPAQWTEEKLAAAQHALWKEKGFAALFQDTSKRLSGVSADGPSMETVRRMMKGAVTVWVDRGITIEKGLGRADRMIGSGFFIDPNGYLITNYHVIQSEVDPEYEGFSRVYVKLPDRSSVRIPAKVIGWDPVFDLALLKTEITPDVYFSLGSSEDLNTGSRIYAIGSPAGLEQTLTSGIVSAQNRRFLSLGSVLQIDAPVNHGSSGGPIIDEAGRVQAIVFAGLERQEGLNFAIPVELLRLILPQLYEGGAVTHAWMACYGISAAETPQREGGTELVYTLPGTSAACIPAGTVITHLNGQPVPSLEALQAALMRLSAGTIVKVSGYAPCKATSSDVKPDEKGSSKTESSAEKKSDAASFGTGTNGTAERCDWYVQLEARPEEPAEQIYRKDSRARAMLPLYGIYLENAGGKKSFRITDVVPGSYADETGFSAGDYLEIRSMELQKDQDAVYTQIYTRRRKSAYLDAFMDIWAYLDSPSYF